MISREKNNMKWLDWLLDLIGRRRLPPKPNPGPAPPQGDEAAKCIDAHNSERTRLGLGPLVGNPCLAIAAQRHAEWMRTNRTMTHNGFSGRLQSCNMGSGGENVAAGYDTGADVTRGWMNSSGHRANILKAGYAIIGGGFDGGYWCAIYSY